MHVVSATQETHINAMLQKYIAIMHLLFIQLFSDFKALLENLKANTTDACCFSNTNITVANQVFSTSDDPTPAIHDILVR